VCELRSRVVTTMISLESDVAARILHEHGFHANFFFPSPEQRLFEQGGLGCPLDNHLPDSTRRSLKPPPYHNTTARHKRKRKITGHAHLHLWLCRAPDSAQRAALHLRPLAPLVLVHEPAIRACDFSADPVCPCPASVCWEGRT
jgi:hypothetical protein